MDSLQANQNFAGAAPVAIHAFLPIQNESAQAARVIPTQQLLFPLFAPGHLRRDWPQLVGGAQTL